jgi:hypothetical protein
MQCQAIIEDWDRPSYRAGPQRITAPGHRRCSRTAKVRIKHLEFCTVHAQLAREGMIDDKGQVAHKSDIRAVRRWPHGFPNGLHSWARR